VRWGWKLLAMSARLFHRQTRTEQAREVVWLWRSVWHAGVIAESHCLLVLFRANFYISVGLVSTLSRFYSQEGIEPLIWSFRLVKSTL
jgi:hypothetical protein